MIGRQSDTDSMMTSLSIAAAFAFALVVASISANPVHNKEKLMLNQDPVKAIINKYFWNEENGKDRSAQAINLWNDIEEDQKKNFYTMRDDGADGDKENEGDRDQNGDKGKDGARDQNGDKEKDGDRDQNGDKDKGTLKPINRWNKEKTNDEAWFKAKIEGPGTRSSYMVYNICHLTAHACLLYLFFFHPCTSYNFSQLL